jgi:hypothetical protein
VQHELTNVPERGIVQQGEEQGDGHLSTEHNLSETTQMIFVVE